MIKNILVPIDLNEESSWRQVLPVAIDNARHTGAGVHVMTVVPRIEINMPGVPLPEQVNPRLREAAEAGLKALVKSEFPGDIQVDVSVSQGNVAREILRATEELPADLIIMASHRPGLRSFLLGANAAQVVRHARCSVYVIRST